MALIERPKSLKDVVLERLRSMIVQGDLPLGRFLSERQLAEDFGTSKTPVREAIFQLQNEGLVNVFPQRGARVFTLTAAEVIDLCDFRLAVEGAALTMAMERDAKALAADLSGVTKAMRKARSRGDERAYLALDTDFHTAFFEHCRNQHLRVTYDRFVGKIAALRTHMAAKPKHTSLSFREHVAIGDAVADRDLDQVNELLRAHIGRTRDAYAEGTPDIAAADPDRAPGNMADADSRRGRATK